MTLPKNITDAIESLASAAHHAGFAEGGGGAPDDRVDAARAALEAAIAAAIQQVEPPTDAEVEAWVREARKVDLSVCTDCPGELYELRGEHLAKGLALMRRARATEAAIDEAIGDRGVPERDCRLPIAERVSNIISELKEWRHDYGVAASNLERSEAARKVITEAAAAVARNSTDTGDTFVAPLQYLDDLNAALVLDADAGDLAPRATGSWNGGPTVTALMRGVEDSAIEWGKCVGDYNAACLSAPPPSGLQATDAVREAGHRCELAYGYFQKAIKALADHDTPTGSLERLRERVQKRMECTDHLGRLVWDEPTRRACKDVLDWIDEETYQHRRYPWHDEERGAGR